MVQAKVERLRQLLRELNLEGVILSSAENIRYFSGFTSADAWLFISQDREALVTDGRYWAQAQAEAPQVELIKYSSQKYTSLAHCLGEWLADWHFKGALAIEGRSLSYEAYLQLERHLLERGVATSLESHSAQLDGLRLIKTPEELAAIGRASQVADAAWAQTVKRIEAGMRESELCAELEYQMQLAGARKPSFDTIVASGPNGAYPHAQVTQRLIGEGELVTVDFGCIVDGWCSDITRTFWLGQLEPHLVALWETVKRAHDRGVEAARPGLSGGELDSVARQIITEAGYGPYFSHSLGHGVGLAVHEGPGIRAESSLILAAGMTLTIEPGIYQPGLGGCRIEDLLYLTEEGSVTLSRAPYQILGQAHPREAYSA